MQKRWFGLGFILVILLLPISATPVFSEDIPDAPTEVVSITVESGGYDLPYYNMQQMVASSDVSGSVVRGATVSQLVPQNGQALPLGITHVYVRWFKVTARNAWGWAMFSLTAKGFFVFNGDTCVVIPISSRSIEWWCAWAWAYDSSLSQSPSCGSGWGQVYAETGFKHTVTGQTVNLWAYIRCYSNGQHDGDGGAD